MIKQSLKRRNEARSFSLYLEEIGKTRLLSVEEEVRLARRIKRGDEEALEELAKAKLRFDG